MFKNILKVTLSLMAFAVIVQAIVIETKGFTVFTYSGLLISMSTIGLFGIFFVVKFFVLKRQVNQENKNIRAGRIVG